MAFLLHILASKLKDYSFTSRIFLIFFIFSYIYEIIILFLIKLIVSVIHGKVYDRSVIKGKSLILEEYNMDYK